MICRPDSSVVHTSLILARRPDITRPSYRRHSPVVQTLLFRCHDVINLSPRCICLTSYLANFDHNNEQSSIAHRCMRILPPFTFTYNMEKEAHKLRRTKIYREIKREPCRPLVQPVGGWISELVNTGWVKYTGRCIFGSGRHTCRFYKFQSGWSQETQWCLISIFHL